MPQGSKLPSTAFYRQPRLLDAQRHRAHRIAGGSGFAFARHITSLPLAGAEFAEVAKEYPIVFTEVGGEALGPVAIVGLRAGENLFVGPQGDWQARYIPGFVRRYPFVLAETEGRQGLVVCLDEGYDGLSTQHGEPLFDAFGRPSPFLQSAVDYLQLFQVQYARTLAFGRNLAASGLLTDMDATADLFDGSRFTVKGLKIVDERKLPQLPEAQALALVRSGELGWIYAHLVSLTNFQRLVERMAARKQAAGAAPRPRDQS
jgi:hypothetical protein